MASRKAVFFACLLALAPRIAPAQTTVTGTQAINSGNTAGLGAITFQGGTLQTTDSGPGGGFLNAISMGGQGTIDMDGNSPIFAGVISGAGNPLNITDSASGGGLIKFSGANTYAAVTQIIGVKVGAANNTAFGTGLLSLNGATLQNQNGAALSLANPILLTGTNVIDANSQNTTFTGSISGAGGLNFANTGGGAAVVALANSFYQGATNVAANMSFSLAGGNAFGSGALALAGGDSLKVAAAGSGLSNAITLTGADTLDAAGNAATFSGAIGGAGSLIVNDSVGGGILSFNGAGSSWSGGTTINGGTLQLAAANGISNASAMTINAGGTFDLNGFSQTLPSVVNNANGTLKTGTGQLTVTGNYGGTGTLAVFPTRANVNLSVTGTATLTGGTLAIQGRPISGTYSIVNAGTLAGTFNPGVTLPSGYSDVLNYVGNTVQLVLQGPSYIQPGQSPNQAAVGSALNAAVGNPTADMANILAKVNILAPNPAQMNAALDQLSPIGYAAMSGLATAGAGLQAAAVGRRAAGLQGGGGPSADHVAYYKVSGPSPYPGTLVADAGGGPVPIPEVKIDHRESPWGIYGSALDSRGRLDGISGGAGTQPGYIFTDFGVNLGADYRFGENFAAGVTAGVIEGGSSLDSGAGSVSNESKRFGAYGAAWSDALRVDLYLGGALDSYTTTRNLAFLGRSASASPSASEIDFDAAGSYDFKGDLGLFSPFVSLDYNHLSLAGFSENGAGDADLNVGAQSADSFKWTLGSRVSHKFSLDWFGVTPFASLGWEHEFLGQGRTISAQFATGTGAFAVNTNDTARDGLLAAAGVNMDFTESVALRLDASDEIRADYFAKTLDASLRVRF